MLAGRLLGRDENLARYSRATGEGNSGVIVFQKFRGICTKGEMGNKILCVPLRSLRGLCVKLSFTQRTQRIRRGRKKNLPTYSARRILVALAFVLNPTVSSI